MLRCYGSQERRSGSCFPKHSGPADNRRGRQAVSCRTAAVQRSGTRSGFQSETLWRTAALCHCAAVVADGRHSRQEGWDGRRQSASEAEQSHEAVRCYSDGHMHRPAPRLRCTAGVALLARPRTDSHCNPIQHLSYPPSPPPCRPPPSPAAWSAAACCCWSRPALCSPAPQPAVDPS
jgi:hypothetical protein